MDNSKYLFVVNPKAGKKRGLSIFNQILRSAYESKEEDSLSWMCTSENKEITKRDISYRLKDNPNLTVYSVGGDGTLNDVINSVDSNTRLGIIPIGSGNDFYRVSSKLKGDRKINLGAVNGRKFINIASLGLDARIADRANYLKENYKKTLIYFRAILSVIKDNRPIEYTINGEKDKSTIFVVGNGKYYGNGVPINPEYDLSNNYLNIISAPELKDAQIIKFILKALTEKHIDDPMITHYMTKKLNIISNEELLCNIDGEIMTSKEFDFEVIEEGITLTNDYPRYVKKAINLIK